MRVAGGAPVRLSGLLPVGVSVDDFQISADSQRVVYMAAQETTGQTELYSIPIAGPEGFWIKLNDALPAGGDVSNLQISPDSTSVIYLADQAVNNLLDAWAVPIDGGTPNSSRVVYQATQDSAAFAEIYSVPLAGGSAVKLNPALPAGANPYALAIAPDSANVVYMADQINFGEVELFSVPLAGGASVRVSDDLAFGGNVTAFKIAPTSGFAFYIADLVTNGVPELFRGRIAGISGADERVSGPLVAGSAVGGGLSWAILPDGRQAIYNADQEVDGQNDLYLGDLCVLCDGFEAGDSGRWD